MLGYLGQLRATFAAIVSRRFSTRGSTSAARCTKRARVRLYLTAIVEDNHAARQTALGY